MELISLDVLCTELSISLATGNNWLRLEKIIPTYIENNKPYFDRKYVDQLKEEIKTGVNTSLRSRRNKKYISGNRFYQSYVSKHCSNVEAVKKIVEIIDKKNILLDKTKIQILLADCAVKLFAHKQGKNRKLIDFIEKRICFGEKDTFIWDLLQNLSVTKAWMDREFELFDIPYIYEHGEDVLGLLYISCNNIGKRKATGAYYTPTHVVKQLINKVIEKNGIDKTYLDPCCGTGNFLLQLPNTVSMKQIYGNDLDAISVKITRINMALRFPDESVEVISEHITNANYLSEYTQEGINVIFGNPPWGYTFSDEDTTFLRQQYQTAVGKKVESYDVFVEKSLSLLKEGGILSFVLPEAILNTKLHKQIREIIMKKTSIQYVQYLGDIFDKVQCPAIILQLMQNPYSFSCYGTEIKEETRQFTIKKERQITSDCFTFTMTDEEYLVMEKIMSFHKSIYLKNQADFALGIVTGNNKKYIYNEKTDESEVVLKGSDLLKYGNKEAKQYIKLAPEKFQQIAPLELYRSPEKLLYRFISKQLIFAYDDKKTLSLNSCNVLIPRIKELDIKYILAILNSRIAQFIYQKKFHSVKVLKSHLEQIPIPYISADEQKKMIEMVEQISNSTFVDEKIKVYEFLDRNIGKLYGLDEDDYNILRNAVENIEKYLI